MRFAVIILHYKAIEATLACVDSISRLDVPVGDELLTVVVDNGSGDGTLESLTARFADAPDVRVVGTGENLGFARGNNYGLDYARSTFDPDFVIDCNNDVAIPDAHFLAKVESIHRDTHFNVLGPDVYNPFTHEHQSPCGAGLMEPKQVDELIARADNGARMLDNPDFRHRVYLLLRDSPLGDWFAALKHRANEGKDSRGWNRRQENVVLHGSFLVFDRKWLDEFSYLYYPETFMYLEENFVQLLAAHHGMKLLYEPYLQIHHLHGTSTRVGRSRWSDRQRFYYDHVLESLRLYKDLLISSLDNCGTTE